MHQLYDDSNRRIVEHLSEVTGVTSFRVPILQWQVRLNVILTERDLDLLTVLSCRVRLLSSRMVLQIYGVDKRRGRHGLKRRLQQLVAHGFIQMHWVNAQAITVRRRPLFSWQPGREEPDSEQISATIRTTSGQAAVPTQVFTVTSFTANLFGSTAVGLPRTEQIDHDLRLAAVYVHYRRQHPQLAERWVGEHALPKAGFQIKDPDAFLHDDQGQVLRVIEASGRYRREQIQDFHDHCVDNDLPYELW